MPALNTGGCWGDAPERVAAVMRATPEPRRHMGMPYLNLSAAFAIPAVAHAASLSPPGAPLTATAPIVTSPTLIGTAPCALIVPGIVAGGAAVPAGGGVAGPEG